MDQNAAYRILDANLNRAQEGLRTLEDIARFRGAGDLQYRYKKVRHALAATASAWDQRKLLLMRDAEADPGRTQKTESESRRNHGLLDIAKAAEQRSQQSLRAIEEVTKYLYPETAGSIESLRYQLYDINRTLLLSLTRDSDFLRKAQLYVLVDCSPSVEDFRKRILEMSRAGVELVQIRDKGLDAKDLIRYCRVALDALDYSLTRIIVNDRADVAASVEAWGLHVGQTDLSISQSRSLLSSSSVVGLSTHDMEQVREAIELGADYIGCGPTFPSNTKSFQNFSGVSFLKQVYESTEGQTQIPAFAIGGIDESNLDEVLNTGFCRIAVSKVIWNAKHPGGAAGRIRERLSKVSV